MIFYFDTSAVNALYDDANRQALVERIRSLGQVRVSEVNVMEVIQNANVTRRHGILRLLDSLSEGMLPLALPTLLVRRIAAAHARGESSFSSEVDRSSRDVVQALRSPELIDEHSRDVGLRWSAYVNNEFDSIAVGMREAAQAARASGREPWFRSASAAIRFLMISPGMQFKKFAAMMYLVETGRQPSESDVSTVTSHPAWRLLFGATVLAMHRRSMRAERYGRSRVAGGADLAQSVYLAFADTFVTQDKGQRRALRFLSVLNRPSLCRVQSYDSFRMSAFA